ncbi:hypothetical protein OF83DRAFT_845671 [Amylostereum chailletii]|nr:hypothetical protein OF83DRAFT_845671 [Amylostereum chailletii]
MVSPPRAPQKTTTKYRTRMGTLVRRSSSALTFTRPTQSRSSRESLKLDPHHATPAHELDHVLPSPVPETPVREGAAMAETHRPAPSRLAEPPDTTSEPIDTPPKSPSPQEAWGDGPITSTPGEMSAAHSIHPVRLSQSIQHPDTHPPTEPLARPWGQAVESTVRTASASNEPESSRPESVVLSEDNPDMSIAGSILPRSLYEPESDSSYRTRIPSSVFHSPRTRRRADTTHREVYIVVAGNPKQDRDEDAVSDPGTNEPGYTSAAKFFHEPTTVRSLNDLLSGLWCSTVRSR